VIVDAWAVGNVPLALFVSVSLPVLAITEHFSPFAVLVIVVVIMMIIMEHVPEHMEVSVLWVLFPELIFAHETPELGVLEVLLAHLLLDKTVLVGSWESNHALEVIGHAWVVADVDGAVTLKHLEVSTGSCDVLPLAVIVIVVVVIVVLWDSESLAKFLAGALMNLVVNNSSSEALDLFTSAFIDGLGVGALGGAWNELKDILQAITAILDRLPWAVVVLVVVVIVMVVVIVVVVVIGIVVVLFPEHVEAPQFVVWLLPPLLESHHFPELNVGEIS
jgi:hypothetical protein